MNVDVTPLPGIGIRSEFKTRGGRRIGVITHRDGRQEFLIYKIDDPDAASVSIALTSEESGTLANLLGAPHLVEHIAAGHRDVAGIQTHQIVVVRGSRFDGATLGHTAMRTKTSASIVAVIRSGNVHASPRPDFGLVGGDVLVVVGTAEGLAKAARLVEEG